MRRFQVNSGAHITSIALMIALALLFLVSGAQAQGQLFQDSKLGISLQVPDRFQIEKKPTGEDILFIGRAPEDGPFASLTLVVQLGNPQIVEKTPSALRNDVVDSYRAVGFIDAEGISGEKRRFANRDAFQAKINYTHNGRALSAGVVILPAKERYFVLTLITDRTEYSEAVGLLHDAAKTVSLRDPPPTPEAIDQYLPVIYWFLGALGLLLVALVGMVVVNRLRPQE